MVDVIPRRSWCDLPPARQAPTIALPAPRVWLHHGAVGTSSIATAVGYVRHHLGRGWLDVGYSFLIADGKVLEGRGAGRQGAHTAGDNSRSHGICIVGDYSRTDPSDRDLAALVALLRHGHARGWWPSAQLTGGHRDAPGASTACPGARLHRAIDTINARAAGTDEEDEVYVVRCGDKGQRARRAQVVIQAAGKKAGMGDLLPRFGADGHYGDETAAAVDRLAKRAKLPEDGSTGMDVLVLDYARNWLSG